MTYSYVFDWKLFLEYLKVFISFPFVVLVLVGLFFTLYKRPLVALLGRMKEASIGGGKATFDSELYQKQMLLFEEKQEAVNAVIQRMPEGEEKLALQQLQEQAKEMARQEAIISSLRNEIKEVSPPVFNLQEFERLGPMMLGASNMASIQWGFERTITNAVNQAKSEVKFEEGNKESFYRLKEKTDVIVDRCLNLHPAFIHYYGKGIVEKMVRMAVVSRIEALKDLQS
ncbi:hypothetical protein LF252_12720 [Hymenobacter sp. BT728]|nr:hypothetical protein [Hymenobacter pini]